MAFLVLACDSLGELLGYLSGQGASMRVLTKMEFRRQRYMNREDVRGFGASQYSAAGPIQ